MQIATIHVEGMSCEHCVQAVKGAVGAMAGVSDVAVDLAAKTVTVTHDAATAPLDTIKGEIDGQGFEVVE